MKVLMSAALLVALGSSAGAHVLVPGPGSFAPDVFPGFPAGTIVDSILNHPFVSTLGATDFSGKYSTWAIRTAAGTIDFVYQFTDTGGSDDINRLTGSNFTGFSTDAGIAGSGVSPTTVNRLTAAPVGFNFNNGVDAGQTSTFLIVETNATLVKPGNISFINSGTSTNAAFSPAVPEPSTWAMLIAGFAGLGLFGWRRQCARLS